MQPGKDHMVSIYLEVGMNNLGSLQSQICFVKRVSSNALSVFGVEMLQTKVAQYTLPLLHCITPCYTTSVYLCYNVLHYITPCCTIYSTSATMCYTILHHVAQYTPPLLQCVTLHYTMLHNIDTITYLWGECADDIVTLGEHLNIKYHPIQWLGRVAGEGLARKSWNVTITDKLVGRIPVWERQHTGLTVTPAHRLLMITATIAQNQERGTRVRACKPIVRAKLLNRTENGTLVMCTLSNINILRSLCSACYYF